LHRAGEYFLTNAFCNEMSGMWFFVGWLENRVKHCFESLLSEKPHIKFVSLSSD